MVFFEGRKFEGHTKSFTVNVKLFYFCDQGVLGRVPSNTIAKRSQTTGLMFQATIFSWEFLKKFV